MSENFVDEKLLHAKLEVIHAKIDLNYKNTLIKLENIDKALNLRSEALNFKLAELAQSRKNVIEKIDANNRNVCTRLECINKTMDLKSEVLDHRLAELNQLRKEVIEDRDSFVKKEVYNIKIDILDSLVNRVTVLETRLIVVAGATIVFLGVIEIILHYFWGR